MTMGKNSTCRILHTADWHLGVTLENMGMEKGHLAFFDQLENIIAEHSVDALVVCGDVMDSANASGSTQRMFYDLLVRLSMRFQQLEIVVTAGNHDAGRRLEAPEALARHMRIHLVGAMPNGGEEDKLGHFIVPLRKNGEVAAVVAAVPFMAFPARQTGGDTPPQKAFYESLAQKIDREYGRELPAILLGHLTVESGAAGGMVGHVAAVPLHFFPERFSYVALGHIHKAYCPDGSGGRVCYSGSPVAVSFDEAERSHSVCLVTFEEGRKSGPERIAIEQGQPLVNIPPQTGQKPTYMPADEEHLRQVAGQLKEKGMKDAYVRLMIDTTQRTLPHGKAEELAQEIAATGNTLVKVVQHALLPGSNGQEYNIASIDEFETLRKDPAKIAQLHAEKNGIEISPESWALFATAVAEARAENAD